MEYNRDLRIAIERNQNISCLYSKKFKLISNLVTCLTLSHKRLKSFIKSHLIQWKRKSMIGKYVNRIK